MGEYRYIQEAREQPAGLNRTLMEAGPEADALAREVAERVDRVVLVGCGDPHFLSHAAVYAFESLSGLPAVAMEGLAFALYGADLLTARTLLVAISQSGKTVQAIEAVRLARRAGAYALAVTNTPASPVTERAQATLLTRCGPSFSFPTKTTTAALALLFRFALALGEARGRLRPARADALRAALEALPARVEAALALEPRVQAAAERLRARPHFTFLGVGPGYATALLAEAKIKETAQLRAEAHPLEEYAHLHVFVARPGDPIFFIAPSPRVGVRAREIAAYVRGYDLVCVAVVAAEEQAAWEDVDVEIWAMPIDEELFSPVVQLIPLQLLAYHLALLHGRDPDRPEGIDDARLQRIIYSSPLPEPPATSPEDASG